LAAKERKEHKKYGTDFRNPLCFFVFFCGQSFFSFSEEEDE